MSEKMKPGEVISITENEAKMNGWISVKDRLPDIDSEAKHLSVECIFWSKTDGWHEGTALVGRGVWRDCGTSTDYALDDVTHWFIPEPPSE